jgi:hypothetical protein
MREREDWDEFLVAHGAVSKYGRHLDAITVDLLLEDGAFASAVLEWLTERGVGG